VGEAARQLVPIPNLDLIAKLGSGGMGDVLLGRKRGSHGFEKLLAVKTIRADRIQDPQGRAMFLDEARLMARIDHPVVPQVHDFGEADGLLYLTMEYVSGLTVRELIDDRTIALDPMVCTRLVAEVCWGLHAAHELTDHAGNPLGVVHRDVTPDNLIIGFNGRVKILDFGIALVRERTAPVTQVGLIRGKPSYMAPEQRAGERIDRRTDLYALSLVFYELLTREPLFPSDQILDSGIVALSRQIPPPSTRRGSLPAMLDAIVMRGLAESPAERFSDAREMALELEQVLAKFGGETLPAFADRALQSHRSKHDAMITEWLEGRSADRSPAPRRATTLPDAVAGAVNEFGEDRTEVEPTKPQAPAPRPRPKRKWSEIASLAAAVAVLGAIVALSMTRSAPETPPLPSLVEPPPIAAPIVEDVPPPRQLEPELPAKPAPAIEVKRKPKAKPKRKVDPPPPQPQPKPAAQPRLQNGIITSW
jgi:eukaryotic-like serine/threonine-protein kinase